MEDWIIHWSDVLRPENVTHPIKKNVVHSYVRNVVREHRWVFSDWWIGMDDRVAREVLKIIYNEHCVNDDITSFLTDRVSSSLWKIYMFFDYLTTWSIWLDILWTREQRTDGDEVYHLFFYTMRIVLNDFIHPLCWIINEQDASGELIYEVDTFDDVHGII